MARINRRDFLAGAAMGLAAAGDRVRRLQRLGVHREPRLDRRRAFGDHGQVLRRHPVMREFLEFAASVIGVPAEALSPESACGSIPEWDSVAHLRLVMESEERYGVSIPLERIPSLTTLADFAVAAGVASAGQGK